MVIQAEVQTAIPKQVQQIAVAQLVVQTGQ